MNELKAFYQYEVPEAGCDEAGRGSLAGPVVAAAVILDPDRPIFDLNDSKKLSASRRIYLYDQICHKARAWSIAEVSVEEINQINILNASILAMKKAAINLSIRPGLLLVDGNQFPDWIIPHKCLVKGDSRFQAIAAASILAKVYRDNLMMRLHDQLPGFQWNQNKGYPTRSHVEAIKTYGVTRFHRKKFVSKFVEPDLFLQDRVNPSATNGLKQKT